MPYQQVTLAQLRLLVENQLGEAALPFWRVDEKNRYINLGLRFYNLLTGFWKGRASITTTANTVWYLLPSSITSNMRVSYNGVPMSPVGLYDLDFGRPNWESETTASGGDVPTSPSMWGIGALNLISIWPADAAGGNSLIVDGLLTTPFLTNDGDYVDIGQEELNSLLDLLQHIAVFKEGGAEWKTTLSQFKGFLEDAGKRNGILKDCATYRSFLGLDTGRRKQPFAQESETGAR